MSKNTSSYLKLALVSIIYLALCILYFTHTGIPYKVAFPVASLLISALWVAPWQITMALLFSVIGDIMGTRGTFLWQMCSFGIAHIFLIWFFINRFFHSSGNTSVKNILFTTLLVVGVCVFALYLVIPEVPAGTLRHCATIYAIIISIMLWCALLQNDASFAIAGILFVASDLVLGWNRFVSHIPYSTYFIMVPYYASQLLFFIRSVKA